MRLLFLSLLTATALLSASQGRAQQRPATAPDSTPAPPAPLALGTVDVIVRTNGDELPVRVLSITPQVVRYLPPPPVADAAAAAPDTLQLVVTEVFMIRYADGTKKRFQSPRDFASAVSSLVGLSAAQRHELGRQDCRRYYEPAKGVFWGTFASTAAAGPAGLVVGSAAALSPPSHLRLKAPAPVLFSDPDYSNGYHRQAKSRKAGKAALGFGLGAASLTLVLAVLSSTMFGGNLLNMY